LAADFGVKRQFLDLSDSGPYYDGSDKNEVIICAHLPEGKYFQILLQSENGGYCQTKVQGSDSEADPSSLTAYPPEANPLGKALKLKELASCKSEDSPTFDKEGNPPPFDPKKIRYLGIQKAWGDDASEGINITIASVRFNGDRSTPCVTTTDTTPGTATDTATGTAIDTTPGTTADAGTPANPQ
jgi:hypothetical protein